MTDTSGRMSMLQRASAFLHRGKREQLEADEFMQILARLRAIVCAGLEAQDWQAVGWMTIETAGIGERASR